MILFKSSSENDDLQLVSKDIWTYIQSVKNILPEKKDKYLRLCDVRKLLEAVMTMPGNLELDGNNCESV